MNFSLPPRPPHHIQHRPPRRYQSWGTRSGYQAVDKARYVHANYRFIVNPQKNYHAQATNADVHLDWDTVLQVLVSSETQATSCPICLSTPVAPRMARCGHIFCLPCLIRFMHSTDEANPIPEKKARWKKCPICWDTIYISETRCVGWYTGQQAGELMEGGDVFLRLVLRRAGSTLALPRDGAANIGPDEDIPWYHIADVPDYARIMKGGEDYMLSHYDMEIDDLKKQQHEDELLFGEDSTWTRKAIATINDAKEKIKGIGNPPELSRSFVERPPVQPARSLEPPTEEAPDMYHIQHAAKSGQSSPNPAALSPRSAATGSTTTTEQKDISLEISKLDLDPDRGIRARCGAGDHTSPLGPVGKAKVVDGSRPSDQPYYFYQSLPHFYLSPLDIRILKAEFGDFSHFPSTILPRIEHISTGHVVDDELRKRTKYLGHLPYGCEVNFLECDWTDLVSPSILETFGTEIGRRRKRNREKATREEKERIRAEKAEEDQKWAAVRKKRPSFSVSPDRPFSDNDFQPLAADPAVGSDAADGNFPSTSPPWSFSRAPHHSFAALASPSSSPPTRRTVWGTTVVESSSSPTLAQDQHAPVDDGWLQDWEKDLLVQQEAFLAPSDNSSSTPAPAATGGGGKRKKNKMITLMSTTARRAA